MRIVMAPALLLFTAGCASTPEVRSLAASTGTYVTSLNEGTRDFVDAQSRLNRENEDRLQSYHGFAATNRSEVSGQVLAWEDSGDRRRLASFQRATAPDAATVVDSLKQVVAQPAALKFDGSQGYSNAAAALAEISKRPSLLASLRGLLVFGKEVVNSYEDLSKKAKEETDKAGAKASEAEKSAQP